MKVAYDFQNTTAFSGFTVLQPGLYTVQIIDEKYAPLRSGNGHGLTFEYEIVDGPQKGVRFRELINIGHTSAGARGVAEARIKAIAECVGLQMIYDTTELFHRPFAVVLGVTKDKNDNDWNEVVEYRRLLSEQPTQARAHALTSNPYPGANPAPNAGRTTAAPAPNPAPAPNANPNVPFWTAAN